MHRIRVASLESNEPVMGHSGLELRVISFSLWTKAGETKGRVGGGSQTGEQEEYIGKRRLPTDSPISYTAGLMSVWEVRS